jgi:hypothetical protein
MRGGASIRLRMEQLLSLLADGGARTRRSTSPGVPSRVQTGATDELAHLRLHVAHGLDEHSLPNAPDATTPTLAVLAKRAGSRTVGGMPRCVPFVHTAVAVST